MGYFILGIGIGMLMKGYRYKGGMMFGLVLGGGGGVLLFGGGMVKEYWGYVWMLFVMGRGMCLLERGGNG